VIYCHYCKEPSQTKDIESLRFKRRIIPSQRKYVLDMLFEVGLLGCRATGAPMKLMSSCYQIRRRY